MTSIASARPWSTYSPSAISQLPSGAAADSVPAEKRGLFLERVFARLQLHRGFTDADLDDAVRTALTGLIQSTAGSGSRFPPPWSIADDCAGPRQAIALLREGHMRRPLCGPRCLLLASCAAEPKEWTRPDGRLINQTQLERNPLWDPVHTRGYPGAAR